MSSPKYWKASHQLLIHWFPNFNNTQHFIIIDPSRYFNKTNLSNFSYTYILKFFIQKNRFHYELNGTFKK